MSDPAVAKTTEPGAKDLAILAASLSRFLSRLSNSLIFQEAGISLAEWSALTVIAEKSGINSRQLADTMGVTAQRINQIADALKVQGLIALSQSADDTRKKLIVVTADGAKRLKDIDNKYMPIIESLGVRKRALRRVNHTICNTLMRVIPIKPPAA